MISWNWASNQYWIDLEKTLLDSESKKEKQEKKQTQAELVEVLHLRSQFDYSFASSAPPNIGIEPEIPLETPVKDYIVDTTKDIAATIGKGYISNWLIATGTYLLNPVSPTDVATPGPGDEILGGILVATGWTLKFFW